MAAAAPVLRAKDTPWRGSRRYVRGNGYVSAAASTSLRVRSSPLLLLAAMMTSTLLHRPHPAERAILATWRVRESAGAASVSVRDEGNHRVLRVSAAAQETAARFTRPSKRRAGSSCGRSRWASWRLAGSTGCRCRSRGHLRRTKSGNLKASPFIAISCAHAFFQAAIAWRSREKHRETAPW